MPSEAIVFEQLAAHPSPEILSIWWLKNPGNESHTLKLVPDGHPEIVVPIAGQEVLSAIGGATLIKEPVVIGQFNTGIEVTISPGARILNIKLAPTALASVISDSAHLLLNQVVEVRSFSKPLHDWCLSIPNRDSTSVAWEFSRWFRERSYHHLQPVHDLLVQSITHPDSALNTWKRLRSKINVSDRHLQRVFKERVGLSPKQYEKVIMVKKASLLLRSQPQLKLVDIAAQLDYFDFSHLSKDFGKVLGASIGQFKEDEAYFCAQRNADYLRQWSYSNV